MEHRPNKSSFEPDGAEYIFQAVQPSRGKTVAASLKSRWAMDLVNPAEFQGATYSYILA